MVEPAAAEHAHVEVKGAGPVGGGEVAALWVADHAHSYAPAVEYPYGERLGVGGDVGHPRCPLVAGQLGADGGVGVIGVGLG